MADEKTGTGAPDTNTPDPITQVKGEFNRKLGNMESQISEMKKTNDALVAALQAKTKTEAPAASSDEDAIEKDWFDNPGRAAARLTQKVTQEVTQRVASTMEENNRRAGTINELVQQFPELQSADHGLTKRAVEIYNSMSDSDKTSPIAYKAAVNQAALEQGVVPKSKRQESDESDDFTLSGNGASNVRQTERNRNRGTNKIAPETVEFARLMGVNIDDEKVKERIKNNHGRRGYTRYE